ncbi:MAG: hypothetical protein AAF356_09215 [Planctomycetota bacterium]
MRSRLRRVILHPGLHKTGSSVVQYTLAASRGLLPRRCGFVPLSEIHRAAQPLLRAAWDNPGETEPRDALRACLRGLADSAARPEVLLSYEGMPGRPHTAYAEATHTVPILAEAFDGLDVRVLLDVKRQDRFFESLYLQHIQMGRDDRDFTPWFSSVIAPKIDAGGFDWLKLVEHFAGAFGADRVRVRPFMLPQIGAQAHVRRFLADIGHPTGASFDIPQNTNQSYSAKALEIARAVNHLLEEGERKDLRLFLRRRFATPRYQKPVLLDDETRASIVADYAESNAELTRRFMHGSDAQEPWYAADA